MFHLKIFVVVFIITVGADFISLQTEIELSCDDLNTIERHIQTALADLAAGDGPNYQIGKLISGTQQCPGAIYDYNLELIDIENNNVTKSCKVQTRYHFSGILVNFNCVGEESIIKFVDSPSHHTELYLPPTLTHDGYMKAEINLETIIEMLAREGRNYRVGKINSVRRYLVGRVPYKNDYDLELIDVKNNNVTKKCIATLRLSLDNGSQMTFVCEGEEKIVKNMSDPFGKIK